MDCRRCRYAHCHREVDGAGRTLHTDVVCHHPALPNVRGVKGWRTTPPESIPAPDWCPERPVQEVLI